MAQLSYVCLFALAACTLAERRQAAPPVSLATIPVHMYANDCGKQRSMLSAASRVMAKNPGAGLGATEVLGGFGGMKMVLKDGFFQVSCVKDMLFNHGDKFGDNHVDYTLGEVSNVSIVRYSTVVEKKDRQEMTHEVCFEFCRTVPDMLYFGLIHGRDCYCAPYFKPMADDSSDCDEVCASKPTQMCGGKTKSLVFEMHECADSKQNLQAAVGKASDIISTLGDSLKAINAIVTDMQDGGQALQDKFGKAGDPAAADLFQGAKVFAGEMQHESEGKQKIIDALSQNRDIGAKLSFAGDFKDQGNALKAEELTSTMEKLVVDAEDGVEDLAALSKLASPVDADLAGSPSKQYYSLMYFVDKKFENVPSTCTGTVDKKPMIGLSLDECASACDEAVLSCVGYSYYPSDKFCFLFSKFTEVTYYTGCGGPVSFIFRGAAASANVPAHSAGRWADGHGITLAAAGRANAAADVPTHPTCYAKLSETPTTIAPDASGKCSTCLKTATKAARCYE